MPQPEEDTTTSLNPKPYLWPQRPASSMEIYIELLETHNKEPLKSKVGEILATGRP